MQPNTVLQAKSIVKSFPGVKALKGVSLELRQGEVLALIGENGAGKSTLMKILAGIQSQDKGELVVNGRTVEFTNVQQATSAGIALIHQELNLCDNLDLATNIFLGRENSWAGLIKSRDLYGQAEKHLREIGLNESPTTLAGELSVGKQQMVEIAKALSTQANILIMDEPTSSLSQQESENLFRIIRQLQQKGVSIIYISHRLGEVIQLADRVEVFRDGENAGQLQRGDISQDAMVKLMVGREINDIFQARQKTTFQPMLEVSQVVSPAHPNHKLSFSAGKGEILGFAGLVGAGRTELMETLFGITPAISGAISIDGIPIEIDSAQTAVSNGIALVPEDRKKDGLVLEMDVRKNISLPSLDRMSWLSVFSRQMIERQSSHQLINQLSIKTPSGDQPAKFLSGGNQQKVVVAKWLPLQPKLFLLDEPTRGVDVGAKREIYELIHQLADQGATVIFVSSEMDEILGLSDRVIVMHEGQITGELTKTNFSDEAVMSLATGTQLQEVG
ncbi:MAG: sugar ABC transporter ATP-binding protein [Planctomycetota bacterium]|nr:sugar ABC transporter ATP-binding protein [Planctomycetota bacterium]